MNIGRISRFVLRHKEMVAGFWLVIVFASSALMPAVMDRLSTNFDMPGTESNDANVEILETYGNGAYAPPLVPVVTVPEGMTVESPGVREELDAVFARVTRARPEARVVSWVSTGNDAFVSDDRRTTFGLVYLAPEDEGVAGVEDVRSALAGMMVAGEPVHLTGRPALSTQTDEGGSGVLIETLIGGGGALVILLYIFGSALALLPLLIAGVSILTSFLVIGGITTITDINVIVQFVVALIGLGIAIDYALLVVSRWREERAEGHPNELAVQRSMETAGHTVIFSGTTVGIRLLALIALPIPFFRGIEIGGMVIPLISVLATITLLPVILATVGPKVDWPRFRRKNAGDHRGWEAWGAFVVRHRWASAVAGMALLALLLILATQLTIGEPKPGSLNGTGDAEAGLVALEQSGIDAGVMSPLEIIVSGDPTGVAAAVSGVDGVRSAVAPEGDAWRQNGTALVSVLPQSDGGGESSRALVDRVRDVSHDQPGDPLVGSFSAGSADFTSEVYGTFPLMMLLVGVVTYMFLVRAFRSLLLPLKALLLNVLSVAAAYGVLVLVWQFGWGSEAIWGIPSTGSITDWVPVMTFAFLFGLSMDYEVFILHRMREEYDANGDTDRAIVRGLALTGKLVTCAALILFLAFVAMASVPETEIRIMATGLAAGIIIDATVIRTFLVPALVSLMGRWNWWLPRWLDWLAPKPATVTTSPTVGPHGEIAPAGGPGK